MKVIERKICPEQVKEVINEIINILEKIKYFSGPEIPYGYEENCRSHVWNITSDILIPKFLKGEDIMIEDGELEKIVHRGIVYTCLDSMVDDGIVETMEDEDGNDVFWISKQSEEKLLESIDYKNFF